VIELQPEQAADVENASKANVEKTSKEQAKERARNNLNNYGTGFLFLTQQSQEAHRCSKQRLRLH
jgi:hypothetical protein